MHKSRLSVLMSVVLMGACSSNPPAESKGAVVPAYNAVSEHVDFESIAGNDNLLVFYRDPDLRAIDSQTTNRQIFNSTAALVWVDHRIAGSVMPSKYVVARVCPNVSSVTVSVGPQERISNQVPLLLNDKSNAGHVQYFRIEEIASSQYVVQPVPAYYAKQNMLRSASNHLVARSATTCLKPAPVAPKPAPPVVQPFKHSKLESSALFAFDRYGLGDISPTGMVWLKSVVSDAKESIAQLKNLRIAAYTDRIGDAAYNQRLSLARANTVATYLKANGVTVPIEIVGAGLSDSLDADCPQSLNRTQLIACLAPARNVTVDFF